MSICVRKATDTDAAGAIGTLRRSITELCVADHQNDPAEIEGWLANKTEEAWRKWIARNDAVVLIADRAGEVVGVGMATLSGDILLNYVHPDARFCGVSKAVLNGIEEALKSKGVQYCRLESTITAHSFYESRGFRPDMGRTLTLSKPL